VSIVNLQYLLWYYYDLSFFLYVALTRLIKTNLPG